MMSFFGRDLLHYHIYLDDIPVTLKCDIRTSEHVLRSGQRVGLHNYLEAVRRAIESYLAPQIRGYLWYRRPMTFHIWNPAEQPRYFPSHDEIDDADPLAKVRAGHEPEHKLQNIRGGTDVLDMLTNLREQRGPQEGKPWPFAVCPHIYGAIAVDESVDDEWYALRLLVQLSARFPDLTIRVTDTSSEHFVLAEAAPVVPPWLDSAERAKYRLWVRQGKFCLIRRPRPSLHVPVEIDMSNAESTPSEAYSAEGLGVEVASSDHMPVSNIAVESALAYVRGPYSHECWPPLALQCALQHRLEATRLHPIRSLLYPPLFLQARVCEALQRKNYRQLSLLLRSPAAGLEVINNSVARPILVPVSVAILLDLNPAVIVPAITELFSETITRKSSRTALVVRARDCVSGSPDDAIATGTLPDFVLTWVRLPKLMMAQLLRCRIQPHKQYLASLPSGLPAEIRTTAAMLAADGMFLREADASSPSSSEAEVFTSDLFSSHYEHEEAQLLTQLSQATLLGARVVSALEAYFDAGFRKLQRQPNQSLANPISTQYREEEISLILDDRERIVGCPTFAQAMTIATSLMFNHEAGLADLGMNGELITNYPVELLVSVKPDETRQSHANSAPHSTPLRAVWSANVTKSELDSLSLACLRNSPLGVTNCADYRKIIQDAANPTFSSADFYQDTVKILQFIRTRGVCETSGSRIEEDQPRNIWIRSLQELFHTGPPPLWFIDGALEMSGTAQRLPIPTCTGLGWLYHGRSWNDTADTGRGSRMTDVSSGPCPLARIYSALEEAGIPKDQFLEHILAGDLAAYASGSAGLPNATEIQTFARDWRLQPSPEATSSLSAPSLVSDSDFESAMEVYALHGQQLTRHFQEAINRGDGSKGLLQLLSVALGMLCSTESLLSNDVRAWTLRRSGALPSPGNSADVASTEMDVKGPEFTSMDSMETSQTLDEGINLNDEISRKRLDDLLGLGSGDPMNEFLSEQVRAAASLENSTQRSRPSLKNLDPSKYTSEIQEVEPDEDIVEIQTSERPRAMIYSLLENGVDQASDAAWIPAGSEASAKEFAELLDKERAFLEARLQEERGALQAAPTFYLVPAHRPRDPVKASSSSNLASVYMSIDRFVESEGTLEGADPKGANEAGGSMQTSSQEDSTPCFTAEFLHAFSNMDIEGDHAGTNAGATQADGFMTDDFMNLMNIIKGLDELQAKQRANQRHRHGRRVARDHETDECRYGDEDEDEDSDDAGDDEDEDDDDDDDKHPRAIYSGVPKNWEDVETFEEALGLANLSLGDDLKESSDDETDGDDIDYTNQKPPVTVPFKKRKQAKSRPTEVLHDSEPRMEISELPQDIVEELNHLEEGGYLRRDHSELTAQRAPERKKQNRKAPKAASASEFKRVSDDEDQMGEAMRAYMAALDAQLQGEAHLDRALYSVDQDDASRRANEAVHVIESLANAQIAQAGLPGPASTFLGMLGATIPAEVLQEVSPCATQEEDRRDEE